MLQEPSGAEIAPHTDTFFSYLFIYWQPLTYITGQNISPVDASVLTILSFQT